MDGVRARAFAIAERVAAGLGLEVVEVEWTKNRGRNLLRIYIDRPGGRVTVDDCGQFSEAVSPVLDREEAAPGSYDLEVSSPGIERPLVKPADFARFAGSMIRFRTKRPIEGRRNFTGNLVRADEREITVEVEGRESVFGYEDIDKARLTVPPEKLAGLLKGSV